MLLAVTAGFFLPGMFELERIDLFVRPHGAGWCLLTTTGFCTWRATLTVISWR